MNERRKQYPFDEIEPRWQQHWLDRRTFHALNPGDDGFDGTRPKYYALDMFPYPSGSGLHVGHPEGWTATDIVSRYKRMRGFNVLHPMGWDAFGLPAEQYAIRTGQHPRITTRQNIESFRGQCQRLGFSYDWEREVDTTDPKYFRWTQWIFLQLYHAWFNPVTQKAEPISGYTGADPDSVRLAYVAEVPVNWCPELGTVLANEEVIDGKSDVGGFPVIRRPMRQWMLRITTYADRLIHDLEGLDWPEGIKLLQKNWIGRSEGALVTFPLANSAETISVFTTRPDTLFGATYLVLAPEHALVSKVTTESQAAAVADYQALVASKSDMERTELAKEKTGVFTGAFATNPVNGETVPVWIADYVLTGYGTGAIMAVPAHDERDFEFASKFALPIRQVVAGGNSPCFSGDGVSVDSGFLTGLPSPEARAKILDWLEARGSGKRRVQYKLRDWLFSRQRYWGEPFPITWTDGKHQALPDSELPVLPPELADFKPTGTGEPPLARASDWVQYSETARRETNTMPQWAGSCWYYLRYCDPQNGDRFIGSEAERYWMGGGNPGGVDLYVGGTEHAVLHLLYARFWHKVLFDLGHVGTREPFQKLVNQGMILGEDGSKMSKSMGNVINPDDIVSEYGADSFRLYEMFMGPLEQVKPWSTSGVEGVSRFLARVWRLFMEETQEGSWKLHSALADIEPTPSQLRMLHATIKKVTEDIESLSFNTAIPQMMVFVSEFTNVVPRPVGPLREFLQILNPFAPHLSEDLFQRLGKFFPDAAPELAYRRWPVWEERHLVENEIEIALQINGRVRDKITVLKTLSKEDLEKAALASPKMIEMIAGAPVKKVIVVPGKIVNVVI